MMSRNPHFTFKPPFGAFPGCGTESKCLLRVDARHVAANFWVHIHYLVGLELTGQRQHMGDIAALRGGNLCGRNRCG